MATDALGRGLPVAGGGRPTTGEQVRRGLLLPVAGPGGRRGHSTSRRSSPRDPAAIRNPRSPLWGPDLYPHHWGESVFGYYVSDDESVLRKHAQMLADAGVDMVVFDVTNQVTYPRSWKASAACSTG